MSVTELSGGDAGSEAGERGERGAILPLMAIVLIVLMGTAAMAVDLGWLPWQSIEIQHGADAAALAGVVYEPDLRTEAHTEAEAAAFENGFDDSDADTTVTVIDFVDDNTAVVNDSMLRVTVQKSVGTFFLNLFGLSDVSITRSAVAEYVQPLPMGSPESYFGDDPALGNSPGYVAKTNGSYIAKAGGDRFEALCLTVGFGADCKADTQTGSGGAQQGLNPEGRVSSGWGTTGAQGGYVYGIDVPEGASRLKVEIFSGAIYAVRKQGEPEARNGNGQFPRRRQVQTEQRELGVEPQGHHLVHAVRP